MDFSVERLFTQQYPIWNGRCKVTIFLWISESHGGFFNTVINACKG